MRVIQSAGNLMEDCLELGQDFVIPKTQDMVAKLGQIFGSAFIG